MNIITNNNYTEIKGIIILKILKEYNDAIDINTNIIDIVNNSLLIPKFNQDELSLINKILINLKSNLDDMKLKSGLT